MGVFRSWILNREVGTRACATSSTSRRKMMMVTLLRELCENLGLGHAGAGSGFLRQVKILPVFVIALPWRKNFWILYCSWMQW